METIQRQISPFAKAAVKLLQGAVFEDQKEIWDELLQNEVLLIRYFEQIALDLIVDKKDGYAYLKQIELNETGAAIGLVRRMPLSYELTLVCVLLREWLLDFESDDLETANLYITLRGFRERIELFFKEKTNELKFVKELNKYIAECEKMGFLKLIYQDSINPDENRYEVRRILKARINNEELERFKNQLKDEFKSV